jgi:NADH dehydrogenase
MTTSPPRILVVGGGFVGLYAARGLERALAPERAHITLVSRESFMLYQPFLPEVASGQIEPRHAVVPLRATLRRTHLIAGQVEAVDHSVGKATVSPKEGSPYDLGYDHIVIGVGSSPRVLKIPGLAENALGFTSIGEATYLRNRVLSRLDLAESTNDPAIRRRALTFVFVGAGYTGVEALAELEDLARDACRAYPSVSRDDMRWVLVDAMDRILPEVGHSLGRYALERLEERGIDVHLNCRLASALDGTIRLSDGTQVEGETLVWTAGVKAAPLALRSGFKTDKRGRILADEFLRVVGERGAWVAGDAAAIPRVEGEGFHPPTAQHAMREARVLASNIAATIEGTELSAFRYQTLGQLVSLGRYRGVAKVTSVRLRGALAWWLHRSYHLIKIPTIRRKARVLADWTVSLFFARDITQLDSLREPRGSFVRAFEEGDPDERRG